MKNINLGDLNESFFFQPYMTKYRELFFEDLHKKIVNHGGEFEVICGPTPKDFDNSSAYDFKCLTLKTSTELKFIRFQQLSENISVTKDSIVIHFADFKYLSLYYALMKKLLNRTPLFLHGQGGYKKNSIASKIIYNCAVALTSGYICYNKFCEIELKKKLLPYLHKKVKSIDNTLYIESVDSVPYPDNDDHKIAFIGRIRPRSGLEELLKASMIAKSKFPDLTVEIIGSGDTSYIRTLQEEYPFANFIGSLYNQEDIISATKNCSIGAYGGDAGLSTVHYMSLGLAVIVHNDLLNHMGPEPSYVKDHYNGLLFERNNINDMADKICLLFSNKELTYKLRKNALKTFHELSSPSMAEKLLDIILDKEIK
ncbi:glycosyltransferase family 4 protein [Klebsiella quasipneumoniae]|nr:glycosyltransferase family 4 protein [Klebsiella quasipneumoniae]